MNTSQEVGQEITLRNKLKTDYTTQDTNVKPCCKQNCIVNHHIIHDSNQRNQKKIFNLKSEPLLLQFKTDDSFDCSPVLKCIAKHISGLRFTLHKIGPFSERCKKIDAI